MRGRRERLRSEEARVLDYLKYILTQDQYQYAKRLLREMEDDIMVRAYRIGNSPMPWDPGYETSAWARFDAGGDE